MSILDTCIIVCIHLTDVYLPQSCKTASERSGSISGPKPHSCPVGLGLTLPPLGDVSIAMAMDSGHNCIFFLRKVLLASMEMFVLLIVRPNWGQLKENNRVSDG